MARNEEKANAMLNRFLQQKKDFLKPKTQRRPRMAADCDLLPEAEKWRMQIIREISKKVSAIQNAGLGEFKIRDLNDEINRLMREKYHWDRRIHELGGPNYMRTPGVTDGDGSEVRRHGKYYYFGAAKELPGVKELFEKEDAPKVKKRTRADYLKSIGVDYYGYRDDDDGVLAPLEMEMETKMRAKAEADWKGAHASGSGSGGAFYGDEDDIEAEDEVAQPFSAATSVATTEQLEKIVLERRKQELLARFGK